MYFGLESVTVLDVFFMFIKQPDSYAKMPDQPNLTKIKQSLTLVKRWGRLVLPRILKLAAEIRIPFKNTQIYGYAEHENDLVVQGAWWETQTSCMGGQGSSYGVSAKLGLARVEYVVNDDSRTWVMFLLFKDRF